MANLKNLDKIFGLEIGQMVTIGNNRTVTRDGKNEFSGRLHGHSIFAVKCAPRTGAAFVTLNTCGFRTVTTRSAMSDFLDAFGIRGNVSFAGGKFGACFWREGSRVDQDSKDDSETMKFWAQRYDVEKV